MSQPYTLDDTMRAHDRAVHDWLGGLPIDYGVIAGTARNGFPILRIYAAPSNAFANVLDLLVHLGWIAGSTATEMRANADQSNWPVLPLPVATIERGEPVMDQEQQGNAKTFRLIDQDTTTGEFRYHQWPQHMATTYRITFWMLQKSTDAYIREWIYTQVGSQGVGQREMLLPVTHPAPWGTMGQRFRLEGSTDLSTLEGPGQRFIRAEYEFTLRTLVFRPPTVGGPLIHNTGVDPALITPRNGFGDTNDAAPLVVYEDTTLEFSDNLWFFAVPASLMASRWPVSGNGVASDGSRFPGGIGAGLTRKRSLRIAVTLSSDTVELLERYNVLDGDSKVIISASFQYSSTAAVTLTGASHDLTGGTITPCFSRALPATAAGAWAPVHLFFLARKTAFIMDIAGTGTPADATVACVDVREVYDAARTSYQQLHINVGGLDVYQWANLANEAWLVVGVLNASGSVAGTVTCNDDPTAPDWSPTQHADPTANYGFVFLIQPIAGALSLTVPTGMALDTVYVRRYHGPYNGNTV